jgi:hypothetical protein
VHKNVIHALITNNVRHRFPVGSEGNEEQAKKELQSAEDVLPRVARECYKWLLCPVQTTPEDRQASIEAFSLNTSGSALGAEIQRVYHDNELVISAWSAVLGQSTLFQPPVGGLDAVAKTGSGKPKSFYGSVEVSPATAKMRLVQLAEEIISNLVADPLAEIKITVEINANFPNGASDQIRRAVAENAKSLGFKTSTWE